MPAIIIVFIVRPWHATCYASAMPDRGGKFHEKICGTFGMILISRKMFTACAECYLLSLVSGKHSPDTNNTHTHTMKSLLDTIRTRQAQLATMETLLHALAKREPAPQLDCFHYSKYDDEPTLRANVSYNPESLALAGEVFGKQGWTAEPDGLSYSWSKTVEGVLIIIDNALVYPPLETRPVLSTEFPIQLADAQD